MAAPAFVPTNPNFNNGARYQNNTFAQYSFGVSNFRFSRKCELATYSDCIPAHLSGVRYLFFADFSNVGYAYQDTAGQITGFENNVFLNWLYLPFNRYTISLDTTTEISASGTRWVSTVSMKRSIQNSDRRNIYKTLIQGRYGIIAVDQNDNYWLVGDKNPMRATADEKTFGVGRQDFTGDTLTMLSASNYPPRLLTAAAIASLNFDGVNCTELLDGTTDLSDIPLSAIVGCPLTLIAIPHL